MSLYAINKQTFEINCNTEEVATNIKLEIENYTAYQINSIINSVLTKMFPAGTHLTIDKLEIDLGDIEQEAFGQVEMLDNFRTVFSEKILEISNKNRMALAGVGYQSSATVRRIETRNDWELIRSFLLSGDLPWWVDKSANIAIASRVAKAIKVDPDTVKAFIHQHKELLKVTGRLRDQLDPDTRHRLNSLVPGAVPESPGGQVFRADPATYPNGFVLEQPIREKLDDILRASDPEVFNDRRAILTVALEKVLRKLQGLPASQAIVQLLPETLAADLFNQLTGSQKKSRAKLAQLVKKLSGVEVAFLLFEVTALTKINLPSLADLKPEDVTVTNRVMLPLTADINQLPSPGPAVTRNPEDNALQPADVTKAANVHTTVEGVKAQDPITGGITNQPDREKQLPAFDPAVEVFSTVQHTQQSDIGESGVITAGSNTFSNESIQGVKSTAVKPGAELPDFSTTPNAEFSRQHIKKESLFLPLVRMLAYLRSAADPAFKPANDNITQSQLAAGELPKKPAHQYHTSEESADGTEMNTFQQTDSLVAGNGQPPASPAPVDEYKSSEANANPSSGAQGVDVNNVEAVRVGPNTVGGSVDQSNSDKAETRTQHDAVASHGPNTAFKAPVQEATPVAKPPDYKNFAEVEARFAEFKKNYQEASLQQPAKQERQALIEPVNREDLSVKAKLIASITGRLGTADPVIYQYLKLLDEGQLQTLAESLQQYAREHKTRRKMIRDVVQHPSFLQHHVLKVYANIYLDDKVTGTDTLDRGQGAGASKKRALLVQKFAAKIQLSQVTFFRLVDRLSSSELLLLQEIFDRHKLETEEERRILRKILLNLSEEAVFLIKFLTELPEAEILALTSLNTNLAQASQATPNQEVNIIPKPKADSGGLQDDLPDRARGDKVANANAASELSEVFYKENTGGKIYIENAGLCVVALYLRGLFNHLGYIEKAAFKNKALASRAVYLLQYLATGKKKNPEYRLQLNKVLCGLRVDEYVSSGVRLTKTEIAESDMLLQSVIENWKALKNTSLDGFRESFIQRKGILLEAEQHWTLQVERKGFDMLLNTIPWGFNIIKLPWTKKHIRVEW